MSYMLMILEPREQRAEHGEQAGRELYARMLEFGAGLHAQGKLIAAESLNPDSRGVRLQVRDGRRSLVDGPFTEAREMVGGFYLLNVDSREEALEIAAACPAAEWATVEVRATGPCYEF